MPAAVARYLASENLPAELVMAPDPEPRRDSVGRRGRCSSIRRGRAEDARCGRLHPVLRRDRRDRHADAGFRARARRRAQFPARHPHRRVAADQVVATYEDGWDRLRAGQQAIADRGWLPRTVNFITGPSRTGDIEQRIVLGAHGPRRLHILVVENRQDDMAKAALSERRAALLATARFGPRRCAT